MNFDKAYKELLKGKKIRRKEWEHFMHLRYVDGEVKTYKGDYTHFYKTSNIVLSNDWISLDGDGRELTFLEALEELKNKKKLTCKQWIEDKLDAFIFIDKNQFAMCKAIEFDFMPTFECFMATDWEIMN
jgi:hypothetical protein